MFEYLVAACRTGVSGFAHLAGAVPAILRNIHGAAQGEPDRSGLDALRDGLPGREIAELTQNKVVREHLTVRIAELFAHGNPELTQTHGANLKEKNRRKNADARLTEPGIRPPGHTDPVEVSIELLT